MRYSVVIHHYGTAFHEHAICPRPAGISVAEWQIRRDLAACYRLCALNRWDDLIYTHISAALPDQSGHFLLNPFGLRFDEVCASNLVKIDLQGNIIGDATHAINVSGFAIHAAVHAARPDALCVMHLHNLHAIAVSAQPMACCHCRNMRCVFMNRLPITSMKDWR